MERIREMDRYQKGLLLLLSVLAVVFGVIYAVMASREGYLYLEKILERSEVNGSAVYSGKISGEDCAFTVTADKVVTFQWGETTYGPYTMREDPTAIPEEDRQLPHAVGIEMKEGDEIIFRGSVRRMDDFLMMTNEDGTLAGFSITATMSDGVTYDENGNRIDPVKPSVATVYDLMNEPELTKRGAWIAWVLGVVFSLLTAASMVFADELFRWNLAFQIRNVEHAEPSDWEIASRYLSWTVLTVLVLGFYIGGLA